ncbi:unnamed protein product, partial [Tetraodon nigroviridis]
KGYDKDLLNLTPATWDFCFKGLVVDLEDGNLVKLADDGTVLRYAAFPISVVLWLYFKFLKMYFFFPDLTRATHGTSELSTEEIIKHYGSKREWKHFNNLNTSFTRSGRMSSCCLFFWQICIMFINSILTPGFSFVFYNLAKYYLYDNYFDLPGALLCGRVVDMLHKVICDS